MSDLKRIALIDVDTSHAWVYGSYLQASGAARVSHVVDSGLCRSRDYVERLASALGAEIASDPADLLGQIDGAMLLGARYDNRLERAAALIDANVPLFFDKPAAGVVAQVDAVQRLLDRGYPLLCGSSLPLCRELARIRRVVQDQAPSGLAVLGCHEFFEHGIHAADIAMSLAPAAPREVFWSTFGPAQMLWVSTDAPMQIALGLEGVANWCVMANGASGSAVASLDLAFHRDCHYARLVAAFLDLVSERPVALRPHAHLDAIRILIAGARSREEQRPAPIAELRPDDGFDGAAYAREYAEKLQDDPERDTLAPPAEVFTLPPDLAGVTKLTAGQRLRTRARDLAARMLGERGKRVACRVLTRV